MKAFQHLEGEMAELTVPSPLFAFPGQGIESKKMLEKWAIGERLKVEKEEDRSLYNLLTE